MLKLALICALAAASMVAGHRLQSTSLAWLFAPPPTGNTFGAAR